MIEGPLDDARSKVIAETHKLIPNKAIRYLVNTHHHWDHSGGIRAFVAEGATGVADDRNKEFYRDIVLTPQSRTLSPDRLSQFPFAPPVRGLVEVVTSRESTCHQRLRSSSTRPRRDARQGWRDRRGRQTGSADTS